MGVNILSEYFYNIVDGVKSFLTGMGLTFKHFKEKKNLVATLQYPNEKWPLPERNIGFEPEDYNVIRSRLHVDIDDCIEQAMNIKERILNDNYHNALPLEKWWKI